MIEIDLAGFNQRERPQLGKEIVWRSRRTREIPGTEKRDLFIFS